MYPVLFVSGNSVPALFSDTPEIPGGCFIAWWECSEGNTPDAMGVVVNAMIAWDCCTLVALSKLSIPVSTDSSLCLWFSAFFTLFRGKCSDSRVLSL